MTWAMSQSASKDTTDFVKNQNTLFSGENGKIEFLKSIQPAGRETTFGIASKPRCSEPKMNEIFSWGYEAPCRNDYQKDNAALSNKIRKMKTPFVTEARDNFRLPIPILEEVKKIEEGEER